MFKQAIAAAPVVAQAPRASTPTRGQRLLEVERTRVMQMTPNEDVLAVSWLSGHSPSQLAWPGVVPAADLSIQVAYWERGRFVVGVFDATPDDRGMPAFKQVRASDLINIDAERHRGMLRFGILAARSINLVAQTVVPLAELPSPLLFGLAPGVSVPGVVPVEEYTDAAAIAAEGWAMALPVNEAMAARLNITPGTHEFVPFSRIIDAKMSPLSMVAMPGLTQGRVTVNPGFECWGGLYDHMSNHLRGTSPARRAAWLAAEDEANPDVVATMAMSRLEQVRKRTESWCRVACDGSLSTILKRVFGNDDDDAFAAFVLSTYRTLYLDDQPGINVVVTRRGPAGEIGRTWRSEGMPDLDLSVTL